MQDWIDVAIGEWQKSNVRLRPGVYIEKIEAAERTMSFKFPDDFKQLYTRVDGFADFDFNEHMFSLWPLEMIVEEYLESPNTTFVGFSDFLIHSYSIGYEGKNNDIYKYLGHSSEKVANTMPELIEQMNHKPDNLY